MREREKKKERKKKSEISPHRYVSRSIAHSLTAVLALIVAARGVP